MPVASDLLPWPRLHRQVRETWVLCTFMKRHKTLRVGPRQEQTNRLYQTFRESKGNPSPLPATLKRNQKAEGSLRQHHYFPKAVNKRYFLERWMERERS